MSPRPTKGLREGQIFQPGSNLASLATLGLLLLLLAVGPLILGGARAWVQLPILAGLAFLVATQGMRIVLGPPRGSSAKLDAVDLTVLLFVGYTGVLWYTSQSEYYSRLEFFNVIGYAMVFFLCRYAFPRRNHAVLLLAFLVLLGLFETGFGYLLVLHSDSGEASTNWLPFGSQEQLHFYYYPRWIGTYGCPNHYGSLLVMAMSAVLALGFFSRLPWPFRIVLIYLGLLMVIAIAHSVSRGSWIAGLFALFGLAIFGLRRGVLRWWMFLAALLIIVGGALAIYAESDAVRDRIKEGIATVSGGQLGNYVRVQLAFDALRIAHDHPIWGTGPGTFLFMHPRYQSDTFAFKAVLAHNDYLNCLADYGLVGFGLAMLFVALVTLRYTQPIEEDARWQERVILATGLAVWLAYLVHSALDFNLHIPGNAMWVFAITGLAMGRIRPAEGREHWTSLPLPPLGEYLGWVILLGGGALVYWVGCTAIGYVGYEEARDRALEIPVNESIDVAQAALKFDRNNAPDLIFLGDLYRFQAGRQGSIQERIVYGQKALEYYQRALAANPLDDTVRARMGRTFDAMHRYPEAYFCYGAAVKLQPYNGDFWRSLGNHFADRGLLFKAIQAYNHALACPYGANGCAQAIKEIESLPGVMQISEVQSLDLNADPTVPQRPGQATTAPADQPDSASPPQTPIDHEPTTP